MESTGITSGADWAAWTDAIASTVIEMVPGMPTDQWVQCHVASVPFAVAVCKENNDGVGEVWVMQDAPYDVGPQRLEVIRQAITDKVPVLYSYKCHGYRTVLLLERQDGALSNRFRIAEAFRELAPACRDAIDDVYLICTPTSPWPVTWLKVGERVAGRAEAVWPTDPGWPMRPGQATDVRRLSVFCP